MNISVHAEAGDQQWLARAAGSVRVSSPHLREQAFVDGGWRDAADGATLDVFSPSTGERVGSIPDMGARGAAEAVDAAEKAFPRWRRLLPQDRARFLRCWHDLITQNREQLGQIMTMEQGKPIAEARGEVDYGASFVEWFAEEAKRIDGETPASHLAGRLMTVRREPIGVVACVTPWNFPSAMIARKAAAALAAGCTVVLRPASETPFSALALAALAEQAGLPPGVFNVVTGDPSRIVGEFCAHPAVRAVSFTGSTEIGRVLLRQGAPTIKRMSMELGGHAPMLIFDDVDLEVAVAAAIDAKFATGGQDCLAANRIYVHAGIYEEFVTAFSRSVATLKVGDGFLPGIDIGPLMHGRAVEKCGAQIDDAVAKGARKTTGGRTEDLFLEPTVLADVTPAMSIFREETFGPVAAILPFADEAEVVESANDSDYGLAAYLYTNDHDRVCRLASALRYGMVAVNCVKMTGAPIPFGGMRQSGLGREGGRQGIEEFTDLKYVCAAYRPL